MDTEAPAARGYRSGVPAPPLARPHQEISGVARPRQLWHGRPTLDGKKGPFCPFLIRLKARLLENLKKGLGNLKYNLKTF